MYTVSGDRSFSPVRFICFPFLAVPLVVKPKHFWGIPPVHTMQMALYPPSCSLNFPQWSEKAEVLDIAPGLPDLLFWTLHVWRK